MWSIEFRVYIRDGIGISSEDRYVNRKVSAPMPPFLGLHVSEGDWSATIKKIWIEDGNIIAVTDDDRRRQNQQRYGESPDSMNAIVAEYVENGWFCGDDSDGE